MAARKTPAKKPAPKAEANAAPAPAPEPEVVESAPKESPLTEFITAQAQSAAFRVNGVGKVWAPRARRADNRLVFKIPADELEAFRKHFYVKTGVIVPLRKD